MNTLLVSVFFAAVAFVMIGVLYPSIRFAPSGSLIDLYKKRGKEKGERAACGNLTFINAFIISNLIQSLDDEVMRFCVAAILLLQLLSLAMAANHDVKMLLLYRKECTAADIVHMVGTVILISGCIPFIISFCEWMHSGYCNTVVDCIITCIQTKHPIAIFVLICGVLSHLLSWMIYQIMRASDEKTGRDTADLA